MKRILSLCLALIMCVGLVGCGSKSLETAGDIFDEFKDNKEISEYIKSSKEFTEKDDPNGIMGEDNQYISKVSWEDERVNPEEDDEYNGGSIELFKNEKDANLRKDFFEYYANEVEKTFTENEYGELAQTMYAANKKVHQKGNAIIIINATLTDKEAKEYFDLFDEAIGDYEFEQKDVPSKKEIKKLSDANEKKIDETLPEMKKTWDDNLNGLANEMETRITALETSLSETDLSQIESDLLEYDIPYFSEKYSSWKERIFTVKTTIENNKKAAEEKAAAERTAALANQNALKSAESYLKYSSFSYSGLIDQLEYEGFTTEQATYAADHCGADWNEQAAKTAESYMKYSSFSRQGLIDQLLYEGFSQEQAIYGATSVGY